MNYNIASLKKNQNSNNSIICQCNPSLWVNLCVWCQIFFCIQSDLNQFLTGMGLNKCIYMRTDRIWLFNDDNEITVQIILLTTDILKIFNRFLCPMYFLLI